MFLDPEVAGRIESLGINVRESSTFIRCAAQKGAPMTWDIVRLVGEQPKAVADDIFQGPAGLYAGLQ